MSVKNILLLDDSLLTRIVIKRLFYGYFRNADIYTSADNIEGLGLAYCLDCVAVIVDSTLPKYEGKDVVDFIRTNHRFIAANTKIIILYKDKIPNLSANENLILINKKEPTFIPTLIKELDKLLDRDKLGFWQKKLMNFLSYLGRSIIQQEDISIGYILEKAPASKPFPIIYRFRHWVRSQVISGIYLALFYFVGGREIKEANISQNKIDLRIFRKKYYPTLAVGFSSMLLVLINLAIIAAFVLVVVKSSIPVYATARTWTGAGTDGTCGGLAGDGNKWSCAANWSGGVAPATTDSVTFDGTSTKNVTIDSAAVSSIGGLTIAAGYSGTITLARTFSINTSFSQSAGTFSAASFALTFNTAFTLNTGATFTASSGTTTFNQGITINGGTFNHNSGTVNFAAGNSRTLSCNNIVFNKVTMTASATITVNSNCALPLGASPSLTSSIILYGSMSGTNTLSMGGTLTLKSGYSISGFTINMATFSSTGGLIIDGATVDLSGYTNISLGNTVGSFTLTSGTFIAPTGTFTTSGGFTYTSGTFTGSNGIISVGGAVTCNNYSFTSITFKLAAVSSVASNCTLPLGNNPKFGDGNARTITINGTLNGTGNIDGANCCGTTTISLTATASLSGFTGFVASSGYVALSLDGGSMDLTNYTSASLAGLTINSGTFTAPPVVEVAIGGGNPALAMTGGTFNANGGTFTLGAVVGTLSPPSSMVFNNLKLGGGILSCTNTLNYSHFILGGGTVSANCNLDLGDSPTVGGATLTINGTIHGTGAITPPANVGNSAAGDVYCQNTCAITGFTSLAVGRDFYLQSNANLDLSSYTTFATGASTPAGSVGALRLPTAGSTFTPPSGTMTGGLNIGGGTMNASPSTTFTLKAFTMSGGTLNAQGQTMSFTTMTYSGGTMNVNASTSFTASSTLGISAGTFNAPGTLTINGATTISGGTFDGSLTSLFDLNSTFALSAGTFIAPSGSMTAGAAFTISGTPTFNGNGGTITFDGSIAASITCNNATFNNVLISSSFSKTQVGTCNVNNFTMDTTSTWSNPLAAAVLNISGNYVNNSSSSLGGANLTVNMVGSSNQDINITSIATFASAFNINSSSTVRLLSNFTVGSISASLNSGTFVFNGFRFTNGGGFTVASGATVQADSSSLSGNITMNGALTGSGTFTYNSGTLTLNPTATISGITGITGTSNSIVIAGANIDANAFTTFTVGGTFTLSSGTFIAPTAGMTISGNVAISGGTFTAPTGVLTVSGALTFSGSPTFNANGGNITLGGGSTALITCNNVSFNDLTVNSSFTKTQVGNCNVRNFTLTAGAWGAPAATAILNVSGNFTQNANTFGGGNLTLNMMGTAQDISQSASGTISSKLNINNGTTRLITKLTVSSQTCAVVSGTLSLNGQTFTCSTGFTVASGSTLRLQGAETLTAPTLSAGSNVIYAGNGDSNANTYTLANWTYSNLTINSTDSTTDNFNLNNNFSVASLTLTAGTIGKAAGATTLTSSGLISINGATFNPSTLSITANGGITCAAGIFAAGSATVAVNGDLTVSGCTMTAPSGTMAVTGNFAHPSGTFSHNNGTVNLTGANKSLSGSTTFNNLYKTTSAATTLTVEAGSTQTVTGTLRLKGASGNMLSMRSATPGTRYNFNGSTLDLQYLDIQDFANTNGTLIQGGSLNISDSGNNTGWNLHSPQVNTVGPAEFTDGSLTINTTPTLNFNITDPDISDTVKYNLQVDDSSDFSSPVINFTSSLSAGGDLTYTVSSPLTQGVSYYWRVKAVDASGDESAYTTANSGGVAFREDILPVISSLTDSSVTTGQYLNIRQPSFGFTSSDLDGGDTTQDTIQIDNNSDFSSPEVEYAFDISTTGIKSFTVGQVATGGAYTTGIEGQLLSDGAYYWRVRSIDNHSGVGNYTAANNGSVAFYINSAPTISSLAPTNLLDGTYTTNRYPQFTFNVADVNDGDLVKYQIQVDNNSDFSSPEVDFTSVVTTPGARGYDVLTPIADGAYYWRVKSIDNHDAESAYLVANSGDVAFNINSTPVISLLGPSEYTDGSYTANRMPALQFNISDANEDNTVKYHLQVDNNSDFVSPLVDFTSELDVTGDKTFTIDSSLTDGAYYWRVMVTDNHDAESDYVLANSGDVAFNVDTAPTASNLGGISLVNGSYILNHKPEFTFDLADVNEGDTIKYTIQVDNNSDFTSPELETTSELSDVLNNSFIPETDLADGAYYWRVKAIDVHGIDSEYTTANSGEVAFHINTVPTIEDFGPTELTDGTYTTDQDPTFNFTVSDIDLDDTVSYDFQLADDPEFSNLLIDYTSDLQPASIKTFTVGQSIGDGSYAIGEEGQELPYGNFQYYWRVRATDSGAGVSEFELANPDDYAFGMDTVKPTGTVKLEDVNKNDPYQVRLLVDGHDNLSGVLGMMISSTPDFSNVVWEPYQESKLITLSSGAGTKNIYVRLKDKAENISDVLSTTIIIIKQVTSTTDPTKSTLESDPTTLPTEGEIDNSQNIYTISIHLVDKHNLPVPGVKVILHSDAQEATTDSQGQVIFSNVKYGSHEIEITYAGQTSKTDLNIMGTDQDIEVKIILDQEVIVDHTWQYISYVLAALLILLLILGLIHLIRKRHVSRRK